MRAKSLPALFFVFLFSYSSISIGAPIRKKALIENFKNHIYTLAHDSLEGRLTGTPGEYKAACYIRAQFKKSGLETIGTDNYFQTFEFFSHKELGDENHLIINGQSFFLKKEYYPLTNSSNGSVTGMVFDAGYGIISPEKGIDDYANITNNPSAPFVVLIRLSIPGGYHPHAALAPFAEIDYKINTAIDKGADGIIFINTDSTYESPAFDLTKKTAEAGIPVIYITESGMKKIRLDTTLYADISVDLQKVYRKGINVAGFINNNKPKTIVIGAHYDHLGYGGPGSLYRGEPAIHNGADDNASGVAMLIELARYFKDKPLNHNLLFVAFSGEELGLYGSNYFVKNPPVPTDQILCMFNFDMVGRLDTKNPVLAINGSGTAKEWEEILVSLKTKPMKIKTSDSGIGPSDHTSFYLKNIPVLHFFTGTHQDYHKPTDDADKINYKGMVRIFKYLVALIENLDDYQQLTFMKTREDENREIPRFTVTLGIVPDYMFDGEGVKIDGISSGKAAEKAGLQAGDIIVRLGDYPVKDMMSYMKALSMFNKGDSTEVEVLRDKKRLTFPISFQ